MIEQQLVDYIKSQLKVGVSKDAIRSALVGAGWSAADVDDSLKTTDGVTAAPVLKSAPVIPAGKDMIAMSDLIPDSKLETFKISSEKTEFPPVAAKSAETVAKEKISVRGGFSKQLIIIIAVSAFAAVAASGAVYFYLQTRNLQDKIVFLTGDSNAVQNKLADLNSQIVNLNKSGDDLRSQITNLNAENQGLKDELLFFVSPAGVTGTVTFDIKGLLGGGGKNLYAVTAPDGLKVSVANSQDAKVDSVLKPLVGSTIEISGTHVTASRSVTVTSINGAPIQ